MYSSRFPVWSVSILLFSLTLYIVNDAGLSDEASTNIHITSDSDLSSSPFVSGGNGTKAAPYLIRDWDMKTYYVRLENIVSHVQIVNLTFSSSSQWCFYLVDSRNIMVQNVTSSGRGRFLFSSNCNLISFSDCNVTSIPTEASVVDIQNGVGITISESRFVHQEGETAAIDFNNQGSGQRFINNYLEGISYNDDLFGSDGYIRNCSFIDSPVYLSGGQSGAQIYDSVFDSPDENSLTLEYCYFLDINNNYFHGQNGILFANNQWQGGSNYGDIWNNTFDSCSNGIATNDNYNSRPSKYNIYQNDFWNCSTYAMDLGWGFSFRIWKNIFYHNAGTDNSTSGSQCKHVNYPGTLYETFWTVNGMGNFWANHRTPDEDNNGIVDDSYTVLTGGEDKKPYTNPYFDTSPPTIEITSPAELYPDRSYLIINWDAEDQGSGIEMVRMRVDSAPWIDVTDSYARSVFLEDGSHFVYLEVTDRAGLVNSTSRQFIVENTEGVIDIVSPIDGEHFSKESVRVEWSFKEYFTPFNQSLVIDGNRVYLPPEQRVYTVQLAEGPHALMLDVKDSTGVGYPKSINFTVDLTDPEVRIFSPQSGSHLSNSFIKINFMVRDNIALSGLDIRVDDGNWLQRPLHETSFPTLLDEGAHEIWIRGTDMSGRETIENVSFRIGGSPLLRFVAPVNGTFTRESDVQVQWEYSGPFIWNRSLLKIGRSGDFQDLFGQTIINITLDSDGKYQLTLRLVDIYGNYIEATTTVIKDTIEPFVGFINPLQSEMVNTGYVELEWRGTDNDDLPIKRYYLKVDDNSWMDMGSDLVAGIEFEEGEHHVRVRAVDQAGNVGENVVRFTVDLTLPEVRFLSPMNGSIITDSVIEVFFEASDNNDIEILNLTIDGKINISVLNKERHRTTIGTDGIHEVRLTAIDIAGNKNWAILELIVDLTEPHAEWIDGPDVMISAEEYTLSWNVSDASGIAGIQLAVNEMMIELEPWERNHTVSLDEGLHMISLRVVDNAGLITTMGSVKGLLVDRTSPEVSIDEERSKVHLNSVNLFWFSADDMSGVDEEYVSLDGGEFERVLSPSTFTFEGLDEGVHEVTIRVFDAAGNYRDVEWTFAIEFNASPGEDTSDGVDPSMIIILVVALFVIITLVVIMVVIRKNRKERLKSEEEMAKKNKGLEKPSKIQINIKSSPVSGSSPSETEPPVTVPKIEETETGSGYIRPEKRDKKQPDKKRRRNISESDVFADTQRSPKTDEKKTSGMDITSQGIHDGEYPSYEGGQKEQEDVMSNMDVPKDSSSSGDGVPSGSFPEDEKVRWDEDEFEDEDMEDLDEIEELEELDEIEEFEDHDEADEWKEEDLEEWG